MGSRLPLVVVAAAVAIAQVMTFNEDATFVRIYDGDEVTFLEEPIDTKIISLIMCCGWCAAKGPECAAFAWDTVARECRLYPSLSLATQASSPATSQRVYNRSSRLPTTALSSSTTAPPWYFVDGMNFTLVLESPQHTWLEAQAACNAIGGFLGFFNDPQLLLDLKAAAGTHGFFLGLSRHNDTSPWHDEKNMEYDSASIMWKPDSIEPDVGEHCTAFWSSLGNVPCDTSRDLPGLCMLSTG